METARDDTASFTLSDGTAWNLVGWKRIQDWINDFEGAWAWVATEPTLADPSGGYANLILSRVSQLRSVATQRISQGSHPSIFAEDIRGSMDNYAAFHPTSLNGQLVLDIREKAGPDAAYFAHLLLRGIVNPTQASSLAFLRGTMLAAQPNLLTDSAQTVALREERARFKRVLNDMREQHDLADARRQEEWSAALTDAGQSAQEMARRLTKRWLRYSIHARRKERSSIEKLHATDKAFTEQMGLKAPVAYWKCKATQHKKAEGWARLWVLIFFPTALAGMAYAFNKTAVSLIYSAQAAQAPGAAPFPTAVFIVASAGLASCAGLVFWVGRLLTKLYLSQHHLRQDAEERATMTETYLALIENDAASTDDRQVILNALFRNTPDGIVKEDGGLDPSIAAALGKFLAK